MTTAYHYESIEQQLIKKESQEDRPKYTLTIFPSAQDAYREFCQRYRNGLLKSKSLPSMLDIPTTDDNITTTSILTNNNKKKNKKISAPREDLKTNGFFMLTAPLSIGRSLAKLQERTNKMACCYCRESLKGVKELAVLVVNHKRRGFYHKNCAAASLMKK
jgi:hypothetical protein